MVNFMFRYMFDMKTESTTWNFYSMWGLEENVLEKSDKKEKDNIRKYIDCTTQYAALLRGSIQMMVG